MRLSVGQSSVLLALAAVMLLLSACGGSSRYTPVSERSIGAHTPVQIVSSQRPDQYRVRKGDTLYSIAFRYDLDYRQLAQVNRIDSSYAIYPGQTLRLKEAPQTSSVVARSSVTTAASQVTPVPTAKADATHKAQSRHTSQQTSQQGQANAAVPSKPVPESTAALRWRWPASGAVLQGDSTSGSVNNGINLAGKKGDPVFAAEAGRVVYAGSGLLGYGNLVIINHNQQYLSAYAHNSRILVKENDMVKSGAKIAEVGSSGATREMLHFEIRRDGRPVDPMKYLPGKR